MPAKYERCVKAVRKKGGANPYAVCRKLKRNPLSGSTWAWIGGTVVAAGLVIGGVAYAMSKPTETVATSIQTNHRYKVTFPMSAGDTLPTVAELQAGLDRANPNEFTVEGVSQSASLGIVTLVYRGPSIPIDQARQRLEINDQVMLYDEGPA